MENTGLGAPKSDSPRRPTREQMKSLMFLPRPPQYDGTEHGWFGLEDTMIPGVFHFQSCPRSTFKRLLPEGTGWYALSSYSEGPACLLER